MATAKKSKPTKKDLEAKISQLEKKLEKLAVALESEPKAQAPPKPKPAGARPAEPAKPAGARPAEQAKPAETRPAETPKPSAPAPLTNAQALEVIYKDSAMSNPFDYKTKTPGYSPAPNRYYERLHAKRGTAPTSDWNLQKAKVTGYTAASNNYFATKQRMAFHPADKRFEGLGYKITGVEAPPPQAQQAPPPPPPPQQPKPDATLPKGMERPGTASAGSTGGTSGTAKQDDLAKYEADYLARLDAERKEAVELAAAAAELAAQKRQSSSSTGSSKGTLPKGF